MRSAANRLVASMQARPSSRLKVKSPTGFGGLTFE